MSGIKKCLGQISGFTEKDVESLIDLSDKYKGEGMSDIDADTRAVLDYHKDLVNELNDLKKKVKLSVDKADVYDFKSKEKEIEKKYNDKIESLPQPEPDNNVQIPTKDEFVANQIEALKHDSEADFDQDLVNDGTYDKFFTKQYEKQFGKTESSKATPQKESESRDVEETDGKSSGESKKDKKLRVGKKRIMQRIKSPARKKALSWEVTTPYHAVLQYFAGKGTIASSAIGEVYGKKRNDKGELMAQAEKFKRNGYITTADKTKKGTDSLDALAHTLWEENSSYTPNASTEDYKNALEEVIQYHETRNSMAIALNKAMESGEQRQQFENEDAMNEYYRKLEEMGKEEEGNAIIDNLEQYTDEYLEKLANDKAEFEKWERENDEDIKNDTENPFDGLDDDVFQKPQELQYAEGELKKAEKELKASKTAFDAKRKELGKEINDDQEDLFGDRKSQEGAGLFDERIDQSAYESVIEPFKSRYEKAVKEFNKWTAKVKELLDKEDSQTSLFQSKSAGTKQGIEKVVEVLKGTMPKINFVYDKDLDASGKWSPKTSTITVNPYYASTDTPIHEAGHVLIDAMGGYSNNAIKSAIKQLKGTELWKETAERYPLSENYTEEDLGKEVLAEAIGREGANIFDSVTAENKFKQFLNYIFDWLKRNLGLDKNIAKSLSRQIISGIGTKNLKGANTKEQFQKPNQMTFDAFRKKKGIDIKQEKEDLSAIEDAIENEELDEDAITELESVRDAILAGIENDKAQYEAYLEGEETLSDINIEGKSLPELIDAYVTIEQQALKRTELEGERVYPDQDKLDAIKEKIAYIVDNTRKEDLIKTYGKEIAELANKRDLHWKEVWFKSLGNISEEFPAMQGLYNEFNQINLDREKERYDLKKELDAKAKEVIKEYNKKHGVKEWAKGLFTSNSAKYFEYMEKDGKLVNPADSNLTKAQKEYLEAVRNLVKQKNKLSGNNTDVLDIIKTDKGFKEAFKTEGFMNAMSLYFGGNNDLDANVSYTLDGKKYNTTYKEAQEKVLNYAKGGVKEKAIALAKLLTLSHKAKRASYKADKALNYKGILTSKFDKPYDKVTGYSKDYHNAAMQLIDDITHVKHYNKLIPLVNAVDMLHQKLGYKEGSNISEFLRHWKNEQIYQKSLQTDPTIDSVAKFLRGMTSLTVMSFAVPANVMNVAIGNYNAVRGLGWKQWIVGQKELFAGDKHRAGFGFVGKLANDINNKYQVVKSDVDSNPKNHVGKWFDQLAFAGTKFGEYQIQLSMFLGMMKEAGLMDSFTYKNGELVVKNGVNEKELEKKVTEFKDKVSDIQGKYDPKDRRNIARYELGKAGLQFKNWIPDWTRERFGAEYIDSKGVLHRGSMRVLSSNAIKEMRADIATHGKFMAIIKGNSEAAKNWRANLNGLLFLTALYIFKNMGDDDDKKKRETLSLQNAFEQVMFVYDPSQAKYLLKSPIASWGIIDKFLSITEDVIDGKTDKAGKTALKLVPHNKAITQAMELTK